MKLFRYIIFLSFLLVGCVKKEYVVFDKVHNDYLCQNCCWSQNIVDARLMSYCEATNYVYKFRVKELGEYADTGPKNYPVVVRKRLDF